MTARSGEERRARSSGVSLRILRWPRASPRPSAAFLLWCFPCSSFARYLVSKGSRSWRCWFGGRRQGLCLGGPWRSLPGVRAVWTFRPAAAARVSTYPAARSASLGPAVLICEAGDVPSSRGGVFARQFLLSREFWSH